MTKFFGSKIQESVLFEFLILKITDGRKYTCGVTLLTLLFFYSNSGHLRWVFLFLGNGEFFTFSFIFCNGE